MRMAISYRYAWPWTRPPSDSFFFFFKQNCIVRFRSPWQNHENIKKKEHSLLYLCDICIEEIVQTILSLFHTSSKCHKLSQKLDVERRRKKTTKVSFEHLIQESKRNRQFTYWYTQSKLIRQPYLIFGYYYVINSQCATDKKRQTIFFSMLSLSACNAFIFMKKSRLNCCHGH